MLFRSGSWELKTRTLGSYVISDKALRSPTGTSSGSSGSSGGSVNNDTGTNNPSTGANDVTGVATALALISLASAAAISLKKD